MSTNIRLKAAAKAADAAEQWPGRSHLSSFIRCLHLLDLDLLDDWPGITAQTLSTRSAAQNLQQRIKAVEWSLFRLFELYDPQLTRDKLRPFFPPESHLQSQNLRAALLRVLTDLKKTGVLERDAVLRKTTFDECKGDKFEELLSGFANLVLRQQLRERPAIALRLSTVRETNRLPLVLAHRVLLRANLNQRQGHGAQLLDHERDISDRRDRLSRTRQELQRHRPPDQHIQADAESLLTDSWTADPAWINALLRDSPPQSSQPNQQIAYKQENDAKTVLQSLQHLIGEQEAQLKRWISFKSSLPAIEAGLLGPATNAPQTQPVLCFDRHKALHPGNPAMKKLQNTLETNHIQRRYDDLLIGLSDATLSDEVSHKASDVDVDTRADMSSERVRQGPSSAAKLPTSSSVLPDADLTLPTASQADRKDLCDQASVERSHLIENTPRHEQKSVPPLSDDEVISPETTWLATTPTPADTTTVYPSQTEEIDAAEPTMHSPPLMTPLPKRSHNLQERTRMSLAGALRNVDNTPTSPVLRKPKPFKRDENFAASPPEQNTDEDSLAQRTRKSMSLLTTIADMKTNNRRISKGPRVSQLFPIDPFETPRRSTSQVSLQTPGSNDSTPREKLFSDEADITSVFKSRPKIAMSPMISPSHGRVEEDSILADKAGDLDLDDEYDTE